MRVGGAWLVAVVLFAGCTRVIDIAGVEWTRAATSLQQETLDEVECAQASEPHNRIPWTVVGGLADVVMIPLTEARRGAAYDGCMLAKGYTKVARAPR